MFTGKTTLAYFCIIIFQYCVDLFFHEFIRWRKLTGKDPPALEMVQKIQALQKRLIARKEEIVDRELNIQEKDRVIDELKGGYPNHTF